MSPTLTAILICTFAPLAAFFVTYTVMRNRPKASAFFSLAGGFASLAAALALLKAGPIAEPLRYAWLTSGETNLFFGFLLDGPNLLMGTIVAFIALMIQIYSLGDMAKEEQGRFFPLLSFFAWSMLSFVYSSNLLQTFIFWELVGLASFLLIGFWYRKPSAEAAAKKAFIMTRIGDVGLFIGLILLMQTTGHLDIVHLNSPETIAAIPGGRLTLITLLLFSGIVGKSAQFPLHTWLPDAMEGPTPVSALLHSATMVAAGVFLFARFHPLFLASPTTIDVVLSIATFTAVFSSTMAMVALDMKRVLAYSSISQLSFMLIGLAAGNLFAGVFHLATHAFFKALLFLSAGSFIHHHGTNDMVAIGRNGGRSMRWTTLGLIVGGAALAGLPPLSGFWSKEAIIGALTVGGVPVFIALTYAAAFLTAYYTFRMICLVLFPNPNGQLQPDEPAPASSGDHHHHGDSPWTMLLPIVLLTIASAAAGYFGFFVDQTLDANRELAHHASWGDMAPAIGIALFGAILAWVEYGRKGASQTGFVSRLPMLQQLFKNGWYVDEFYQRTFAKVVEGISVVSAKIEDKGIDASTDEVGKATIAFGYSSASTQSGYLQFYVATAIVLIAVLCYVAGMGS
jgi:NADH-quinone oxidoreductase subunit L